MPDAQKPENQETKIGFQCKLGACCDTNGRRTPIEMGGALRVVSFPQRSGVPKVLQHQLALYCSIF